MLASETSPSARIDASFAYFLNLRVEDYTQHPEDDVPGALYFVSQNRFIDYTEDSDGVALRYYRCKSHQVYTYGII
jgi:hypothetical protein